MGSDQLFKKRIQKEKEFRQRDRAKRHQRKHILLFCEGEKTEPEYFRRLRDHLRLNKIQLDIGFCKYGNDPLSLVKAAEKAYSDQDMIFCIFDRDRHETWDKAHEKMRVLKKKNPEVKISLITSNPCFEFWFLLHFQYTSKPYAYEGDRSACTCLIEDLKKFLPDYQKGDASHFEKLKPYLDQALQNAERIQAYCEKEQKENPSTMVHQLIRELKEFNAG